MKTIYIWLGGLTALVIFAVAAPMHPMVRVAVVCGAFVMIVGAVVSLVNRGRGPDVVPGSKSRAQVEVELDQLSVRVAGLLERQATLEAGYASVSSSILGEAQQMMERHSSALAASLQQSLSETRAAVDVQVEGVIASLNEALEKSSPQDQQAAMELLRAQVAGIFAAAEVSIDAATWLPRVSDVADRWRGEAARRPSPGGIAARDNFIADNIEEAERIANHLSKYTSVASFDKIQLSAQAKRDLHAMASGAGSFRNDSEIRSWIRAQTRVDGIVKNLSGYLEILREREVFAEEVLRHRTPSDLAIRLQATV